MKTYRNIDVINEISSKDFREKYLKPQKPVIIKGLANSAAEKWTIDYLKDFCGEVVVDVFDNSNKKNSAFTTPDLKMKFRDYIDTVVKDEPTSLRMFLFNIFKRKPELRADFPCPQIFKGVLGKLGYMFFGGKGIKVRIHQDIDMSNVLLTQFHGKKKVVLISPKYSDLLYRLPFTTFSLVDLDKPDYHKYPGLEYVEAQECVLEPGDSLFMPSGYWHYITYQEGGFSVSYRKLALGFSKQLQGFLNVALYMPFDKLMNKLMGQKWMAKKEQIAEERANKIINDMMFGPGRYGMGYEG
jgi:ribosomal protein L16 Arg81 hydroxylase